MEIRHLTYFITIAETLNFTKAAAQLYVSPPALSHL
jgi:DNA-binding transcriptional LysR family regulator